jgi:hypothetical protein
MMTSAFKLFVVKKTKLTTVLLNAVAFSPRFEEKAKEEDGAVERGSTSSIENVFK